MTRMLMLLMTQLLAVAAFAQTAEFGRASGGDVHAVTKQQRKLSGTLGLRLGNGTGYEASLGGELIQDRLWFFAAASMMPSVRTWSTVNDVDGFDAKLTAQPVDWTNVTASYSQQRNSFALPEAIDLSASFLTLRSTTMLSERAMIDFSYSQTKTPALSDWR